MEYENEQVLTKIEELCAEREWSKYKLSKESNIKQSTITSIFIKRSMVSLPNLWKICKAFGMTISQFFNLIEKEESADVKSDIPVALWKKLTRKQRNLVVAMIETMLTLEEKTKEYL